MNGLCDWCGKARTYLNHAACSPEGEAAWERDLELDELDDHEPRRSTTMRTPTKYRKKPVVIEAIRFDGGNLLAVEMFTGGQFHDVRPEDRLDDPDITAEVFDTLHSTWVGVKDGQWIIRGVQGEFYPCDPDVFEATYETVEATR